jgi:hypothetical protein
MGIDFISCVGWKNGHPTKLATKPHPALFRKISKNVGKIKKIQKYSFFFSNF